METTRPTTATAAKYNIKKKNIKRRIEQYMRCNSLDVDGIYEHLHDIKSVGMGPIRKKISFFFFVLSRFSQRFSSVSHCKRCKWDLYPVTKTMIGVKDRCKWFRSNLFSEFSFFAIPLNTGESSSSSSSKWKKK